VLDLNAVVEDMLKMLYRLMGEDVEVRFAPCTEAVTVRADPHQLEQVVINLAVNARDAMPRGGKLLLETRVVNLDESHARQHPEIRPGRYVMLAVRDTGVGMDEATRQRIFEPFSTTKEVGKGTGLGLSMVHGIVAQSGGCVDLDSEPGHGATFKIYLPALEERAAESAEPVAALDLRGKETILVVEDQAEVRTYAIAVLNEYGYRVIQAANAGEALILCEKGLESIDLILTDVVMFHTNGRELVERLRVTRPGIKALFMSGYTSGVTVHHGVLEQGTHFIQKPFNPEELAEKVREVLGPPRPTARILVCDDEPGVRSFLRAVLEGGRL
jgi:CheY-like chemotaxis protein